MTNLMKIEQNLTMTSREIAELTGKRHDHIIRDIRGMMEDLEDAPELGDVKEDKDNRGYTACFHLNKDLTLTLVAGYNTKMRLAIIKRWQELESQVAKPMTQIELILATAQVLADVEKRLVATEQQSKQVQGTVAKHETKFLSIESDLEDVKNTSILEYCPTHAEPITAIRTRINKLYGLSTRVVDEIIRQSPLAIKPIHTIRNTNPAAKGSSYFVYAVKDVNKLFSEFVSKAEMVSLGRYKHPYIEGTFKLNK